MSSHVVIPFEVISTCTLKPQEWMKSLGYNVRGKSVKTSALTVAHLSVLFQANWGLLAEPLNFRDYRLESTHCGGKCNSLLYTQTHTLLIFI